MSKQKLTRWFDGNVKPVRTGVYRRKFFNGNEHYSRWNGLRWCLYCGTAEEAAKETSSSIYQLCQWRGLAEQPK